MWKDPWCTVDHDEFYLSHFTKKSEIKGVPWHHEMLPRTRDPVQSPPKESTHLKKDRVLKIQGSQINSTRCAILATGFGPHLTKSTGSMANPLEFFWPLYSFWVPGQFKSMYFLPMETVHLFFQLLGQNCLANHAFWAPDSEKWGTIGPLRILASYEAKIAKKLQLLDIQACNSANTPSFQKAFCRILKRCCINWITGQNVQKLQIFAIFAS